MWMLPNGEFLCVCNLSGTSVILFKIKSSVLKEVRMTTIVLIRGTHVGRGTKLYLPSFSFWGKLSLLLPEKNKWPFATEVQGFRDEEKNVRVGGFEVIYFLFRRRGVNLSATPPISHLCCIYTSHKSIVINIAAEMNVLLVSRPSMYVPTY